MMIRRRAFTAFAFIALACSDSTAPSGTSGTVSFTFTGAGGGTFSVSGVAPASGTQPGTNTNLTVGVQDTATSETVVLAAKPINGSIMDVAFIGINRLTVGSSDIDTACDPESTDPCSGLFFGKNFNGSGDVADFICSLTTGTAALTEVTATRIKGTFSGTGECLNSSDSTSAFAVTNGSFNVALSNDIFGARASLVPTPTSLRAARRRR